MSDQVTSAQQSEATGCINVTMTGRCAVNLLSVQHAKPNIREAGIAISVEFDRFVVSFVRVFVAFSGPAKGRVVIPTMGGEPERRHNFSATC